MRWTLEGQLLGSVAWVDETARGMRRRGWINCNNGELCLGGLNKDCCCCYPGGYVPYVDGKAGFCLLARWCTMTSAVSKR